MIYAIPVSAAAVMRLDPDTDEVDAVGHEACAKAGKWDKWEGGAVSPLDGSMYCVPQCGNSVLRIAW